MKPNFLVIGAQRTATTWLYFCLKEHPEVYVPHIKEVSYFNRYYEKGAEWYERYFNLWSGEKAVGEASPAYLYAPGTAERIAKDLPGVRLIVTFRNPIDRAFSQYKKHLKAGDVTWDFEAALNKNEQYIERGFYYTQIKRYFDVFPKESMLILFYEDIRRDPRAHLRKIYSFLGIREDVVPVSAGRVVPSDDLGGGLHERAAVLSLFLRKKLGLGFLVDAYKRTSLLKWSDGLMHRFGPSPGKSSERPLKGGEAPAMKPETREMLRGIFEEENNKLSALLGRDLSCWR